MFAHKQLTASGALNLPSGDSHARIVGLQLVAGADAATAIGYKAGSAASGKEFCKLVAAANDKDDWGRGVPLPGEGVWYFALTGTSPILHVYYE